MGKVQEIPRFLLGEASWKHHGSKTSINSTCKNASRFLYRMKRMMMTMLKEVMRRKKVSAQVLKL